MLNTPRFRKYFGGRRTLLAEDGGFAVPDVCGDSRETAAYGGELKTLLDGFLGTITKSLGASAGVVRIVSPNGRELHIAGAVGLPPEIFACESHVDLGCGVCGTAAQQGGICSADAEICRWRATDYFGAVCRRVVAVPLQFRGSLIGVFSLFFDNGREIAGEAAQTLRSFAELIGISLENARLARENRRMNLMAERQAIANEIHDSLAQTLAYTRMRLSVLQDAVQAHDDVVAQKCMGDVNDALGGVQKTVRELITHFRCQMDPLGLQHALQVLVDEFGERTGIALEYSNSVADAGLPLEHELQVFHIVREVLANVGAHSGASQARLLVNRGDGHYVFTIEDNGAGIPADLPKEGHYGLTIIRERARHIGATIELESAEGMGTRVRLIIPEH